MVLQPRNVPLLVAYFFAPLQSRDNRALKYEGYRKSFRYFCKFLWSMVFRGTSHREEWKSDEGEGGHPEKIWFRMSILDYFLSRTLFTNDSTAFPDLVSKELIPIEPTNQRNGNPGTSGEWGGVWAGPNTIEFDHIVFALNLFSAWNRTLGFLYSRVVANLEGSAPSIHPLHLRLFPKFISSFGTFSVFGPWAFRKKTSAIDRSHQELSKKIKQQIQTPSELGEMFIWISTILGIWGAQCGWGGDGRFPPNLLPPRVPTKLVVCVLYNVTKLEDAPPLPPKSQYFST